MKKFKLIILTAFLSLGILGACKNNTSKTDSEGNNSKIAPSAGDETRYNLSEQQEMSMQGDTIKVDSTQRDSIK
ncbi:hypothetical protein [Sphingobacterium faecium]|jgi:hypothetical protein|uniref:hypothetical protein n=1 Tax=Sphingobacterium faecium TaxID=34087 RepID=UPI0004E5F8AF|nr:hypothetical protein [Sphingobacterium faecium]UXD71238.1 hypothetical protein MUK51_08060 [Sphingobacterium faecium]WGQ14883.1 hypothetical protein QG727_00430 [Sphingobacterium faecium]CDS93460.1 conserved exported hypothetical protein [Sphingobacterium sp. PM2-P1-29]